MNVLILFSESSQGEAGILLLDREGKIQNKEAVVITLSSIRRKGRGSGI